MRALQRLAWSGSCLLVLTAMLRAQQVPEIVTDRPDVTEASTVVPKGSLQFENGFTQTRDHGSSELDLSQSLARFGLTDRTEIRVGFPDLFLADAGIPAASGLSDFSVGIKQQIGPLPGKFDLAIIAAVSFPTGAQRESSHGFDPFVKVPWSRPLTEKWSVGGMFSGFWDTVEGRHRFLWEPTFYVERELTRKSDVFVEYAADFYLHGSSREFIHVGTAYRLTPRNQIDFHCGFGLTTGTPNRFWAGGYSFRLDHVFDRKHLADRHETSPGL